MALNDATLSLIAFKNLQGKSMTDINKGVGNESEGIKFNISANTIFMDEIDADPNISEILGVVEFVVADLTLDNTSNNQAYFATYPSGHPKSGQRVINSISPTYGIPYEAKPKDASNNTIPVNDPSDWVYQYNSGIFYMQDPGQVSGTPTTIELYAYKGTLLSDLSSIIGNDGDWEITTSGDLMMEVNGNVLPFSDSLNDIGGLNMKFKDIFFNPSEVNNNITYVIAIDDDGKSVKKEVSSFENPPEVDNITIGFNTAGELEVIGYPAPPVDNITIGYNSNGELEVLNPGGIQILTTDDKKLTSINTTGDNALATNDTITNTPVDGCYVQFMYNGINYIVGDGVKTEDVYFSNDGGLTAKGFSSSHPNGQVQAGDRIYWNGNGIGLDLTSGGRITLNYMINN